MVELRDLRYLISLDEYRHFGRAANAVGLSQSALTKSLQRIESALGAKLFERSNTRVELTEVGKEVVMRAQRVLHEAEELRKSIALLSRSKSAVVRIGVGPAMSEAYVAEAIAAVAQRHTTAQVWVRVDHWQQLSEWLVADQIDFYVADVHGARLDSRFRYDPLPSQQLVWFCRNKHPLARRKAGRITRRDLLEFPLATPKMPPWGMRWFREATGGSDDPLASRPLPTIECESYAMLKRMVASSDCISAALKSTLQQELKDKTFVVLPVDASELTTDAGIIRLTGPTLSPFAEEVIATIIDLAAKESA